MIENKKFKAELLRVQAAKAEMEYTIEQRMEEIQRIQDAIALQEQTEQAILEKIKALAP